MEKIRETITRLLGHQPGTADGIDADEIALAEKTAGIAIPSPLRLFYALAGRHAALMNGFNDFALPHELQAKNGRVLFLSENQGGCCWGFEPGEADPLVCMNPAGTDEWHEEMRLSHFLVMVLYYQCAQGGYEYCGTVGLDDDALTRQLEAAWETVVHENGLFVAYQPDCLIWYLKDREGNVLDYVYFSARTPAVYAQHETDYALAEL